MPVKQETAMSKKRSTKKSRRTRKTKPTRMIALTGRNLIIAGRPAYNLKVRLYH